ncbi:MAG: hypothetical protein PWR01_2785, partial [Clostridiales bacterium]|nr:hypothetical protein [Clostridiales bacterium]MDN5281712.1 hypothetical protein [Candidatus Ozemobacter sp.]
MVFLPVRLLIISAWADFYSLRPIIMVSTLSREGESSLSAIVLRVK